MNKFWRLKKQLITKIVITVLIVSLTIFLLQQGVLEGNKTLVDLLSFLSTIIGILVIGIELNGSSKVTTADMLINLNNYFHDNENIMNLYQRLEIALNKDLEFEFDIDDDSLNLGAYATFFENIFLLVNNKIAKISDIDMLFSFRFFLFMNNPDIQRKYLLATSASYCNLFLLYDIWIDYKNHNSKNTKNTCYLTYDEYKFSNNFFDKKLYLTETKFKVIDTVEEKKHILNFTNGDFKYIDEILRLQNNIVQNIVDSTYFYPLSRNEIIDAISNDTCILCFVDDKLIAVCTYLTEANFSKHIRKKYKIKNSRTAIIDAIFVDQNYRSLKIQSKFIKYVENAVANKKLELIAATIHSENIYSINNFISNDYKLLAKNENIYNLKRCIYTKKI